MANTFAPFGFRQTSGTGSAPTYEQVAMTIASGDTNKVFYGDPVTQLASGYITVGAPAGAVAGIFQGCKYLSVSQKRTVWSNYWPGADANGDVEAYVVNDPNAKFTVQSGSAVTTGFADIGANVDFALGTGNTATGISGAFIIAVGTATTTTLPFRIVSLVSNPPGANGTDTASAANYVVVSFNNAATRNLSGV